MFSEKQSKYISVITLVVSVVFVVTSVLWLEPKNNSGATIPTIENVLDKENITEINIEIKEKDWQWLLENATEEEYRSGNVTINGETFYNVGIRSKGNSSLTQVAMDNDSDRYSLKISFDKYIDGQTYHGIEKLALNNMMSDVTYMKEYISYDLYESIGIPTPEYSFTNIKINGKEWGLYLAVEVIEERFIEKHYGTVEGNLYKPETMEMGGDKVIGGGMKPMGDMPQRPNFDEGNSEMIQGIPNFNSQQGNGEILEGMPDFNSKGNGQMTQDMPNIGDNEGVSTDEKNDSLGSDDNKQLERPNMPGGMPNMGGRNSGGADLKYIDDNIESYSIVRESSIFKNTTDKEFNKFIEMTKNLNNGTNIDQYINVEEVLKYFAVNTFLVNLDSYSGGMYHNYYLYEKDGVFEIIPWDLNMSFAGFSVNDSSRAINFPIDSPVTGNLEDAPLIGKLLEINEYREVYHSYLQKIVNEYINSGKFENLVNKLDNLIDLYVENDTTAFYTYEEYNKSLEQLITFGKDRATSVLAQLNGEQPSTEYGTVATTFDLQLLGGQEMGMMHGGNNDINGIQHVQNGGIPNMGAMPSQENIAEVMKIIGNYKDSELTEEQKSKLADLGIDESMVAMIKNMGMQGRGPQMNNALGSANGNFIGNSQVVTQMCLVLVVLIVGMLFVFKYKRKKLFKYK